MLEAEPQVPASDLDLDDQLALGNEFFSMLIGLIAPITADSASAAQTDAPWPSTKIVPVRPTIRAAGVSSIESWWTPLSLAQSTGTSVDVGATLNPATATSEPDGLAGATAPEADQNKLVPGAPGAVFASRPQIPGSPVDRDSLPILLNTRVTTPVTENGARNIDGPTAKLDANDVAVPIKRLTGEIGSFTILNQPLGSAAAVVADQNAAERLRSVAEPLGNPSLRASDVETTRGLAPGAGSESLDAPLDSTPRGTRSANATSESVSTPIGLAATVLMQIHRDDPHDSTDARREQLSTSSAAVFIGSQGLTGRPNIDQGAGAVARAVDLAADPAVQLAESLRIMLTREAHLPARIEIELDPPELGRILVELSDTRQGVTAHVTASRAATASLIDQQLDTVRQALQNAGVHVSQLQVSYDSQRPPQGSFRRRTDTFAPDGRRSGRVRAGGSQQHTALASAASRPNGRVDLRV
jgi:flagellar hook-length control protein FliK